MSTSGVFSTLGDIMITRRCSVHCTYIMSKSGGYHYLCGLSLVHLGGYYEYIGDVQCIRGMP